MSFSFLLDPGDNQGVGLGFTDRLGGVSAPPLDSLNLGRFDVDDPAHYARNFEIVATAIGVAHIAVCSQVHGCHVERVWDRADPHVVVDDKREADAMVTTEPGLALAIRVADCVPVLFADPQARVVGAAHAGRVGLYAGVLHNCVTAMRELGAGDIRAWIGPHICAGCYEVPSDMARQGWTMIPASRGESWSGTAAIDLGAGAQAVLEAESVTVTRCDPCTSCDPRFFSHRRDHGQTGRQAGLVWLGQ